MDVSNNIMNNHLPVPPPSSELGGNFSYTTGIILESAPIFTEMGMEDSYIPVPIKAELINISSATTFQNTAFFNGPEKKLACIAESREPATALTDTALGKQVPCLFTLQSAQPKPLPTAQAPRHPRTSCPDSLPACWGTP